MDKTSRYVLIKALIHSQLQMETYISLNPTYTNEQKEGRMRRNDDAVQLIIEELFRD